jgi:hypothetical protein
MSAITTTSVSARRLPDSVEMHSRAAATSNYRRDIITRTAAAVRCSTLLAVAFTLGFSRLDNCPSVSK